MVIGIDLRPLQNGHKYRGIGEVAKQVTNRVIALAAKDGHDLVFYENDESDPKELLDIPKDIKTSVVKVGPMPENATDETRVEKFKRNFGLLYSSPFSASECDVFLQYDFAAGIPSGTKTLLVKHDVIPYIFWDKYFESAMVPFRNKALRTTLRTLYANHQYMQQLRHSMKRAHTIVSVSNSTKNDIEKYFHVPAKKSKVAHLGVDLKPARTNDTDKIDVWPTKPYLIFVGAGDARRRVDDLVAAYNNLKANGRDIQLVLVGENFKSAEQVPNVIVRNEILKSSYKDDILLMGYADDASKQKLIAESVAYVYPTKYEGFGIPTLESMLLGAPVIAYKNSSTYEVGGNRAIYAKDWQGIVEEVENLLDMPKKKRAELVAAAKKHAEKFTWDKTANSIYELLIKQ